MIGIAKFIMILQGHHPWLVIFMSSERAYATSNRVPAPFGKSWIFLKIPGPGKCWKIAFLESPGK